MLRTTKITMSDSTDDQICCICLDTNTTGGEHIQKWDCIHRFHEECVNNWNHNCPMCRTSLRMPSHDEIHVTWAEQRNPQCRLNIAYMKQYYNPVNVQDQVVYKNSWKDRGCIESNHNIVYIITYGVIGICEDCVTIQTFNSMH